MTETEAGPESGRQGGSDAELGAALRGSGERASAALDGLYRRHWKAVLVYAKTCCRDPHTAEDLASEAFTRTLEAVRGGGGPGEAWRPYLLAVVRRTAAEWARTERRTELAPDFERWLERAPAEESGEDRVLRQEDGGMVRAAFRSLPERWQAVLWHTEVEGEAADRVAPLLGIGRSGVGSLASRAREGLREAYLTAHAATADAACRPYASLMGAEVRRAKQRPKRALGRHLDECPRCRAAFAELTGMNRRMRAVLPAAVLLWAGPFAGATALQTAAAGGAVGAVGAGSALAVGKMTSGPLLAGAAALGTATVIGGAAVLGGVPAPDADRPDPGGAATDRVEAGTGGSGGVLPAPGAASQEPAPDSVSEETPDDEDDKDERKDKKDEDESDSSRVQGDDLGPGADEARLMNAGTGACVLPEGDQVVLRACDGGEDEVWETFAAEPGDDRTWLRNAETGGCLDYGSGGGDGDAVTHGPCRADREGQMFRFLQHPDGTYYVVTEESDPEGNTFQLGVDDWDDGGAGWWGEPAPPPDDDSSLVTVYNYYDAVSLRFTVAE